MCNQHHYLTSLSGEGLQPAAKITRSGRQRSQHQMPESPFIATPTLGSLTHTYFSSHPFWVFSPFPNLDPYHYISCIIKILQHTPILLFNKKYVWSILVYQILSWGSSNSKTAWKFLKELKVKLSHDPAISHLDILVYTKEKISSSKTFLNSHIHSSVIHNTQAMETTQVPINRWVKKWLWDTHIQNTPCMHYS